jgi:hypothetical protein
VAAALEQEPDRDRAALWALRLLVALGPAASVAAPPLPFVRALLLLCATGPARPPPATGARARPKPLSSRERAEALALAAALPRSLLTAGVEDARLVVPASADAFLRALAGATARGGDGEEAPLPQQQQQQQPLAVLASRWPAADHPLVGQAVVEFFDGVGEAVRRQERRAGQQQQQQRRRRQQQQQRRQRRGPDGPLAELIAAATAAARQATGAAPPQAAEGLGRRKQDDDDAGAAAAAALPAALARPLAAAAGAGVVAVASGAVPSAAAAARFLSSLAQLVLEPAQQDPDPLAPEAALVGRAALEAARMALLAAAEEEEEEDEAGGNDNNQRGLRWRPGREAARLFGGAEEARAALEAAGIEARPEDDAGAAAPLLLEAAAVLAPAATAAAAEAARQQQQLLQSVDNDNDNDSAWGIGAGFFSPASGDAYEPSSGASIPEAPGEGCPAWGAALRAACALRAASSSSSSGMAPLEALRCLEALAHLSWNPGAAFLDGALLPPLVEGLSRHRATAAAGAGDGAPTQPLLTAAHAVRALRALAEMGHRPTDEWWLAAQDAPIEEGLAAACRAAAADGAAAAAGGQTGSFQANPGSKGFVPLATRAASASAVLEAVGAAASSAARLRLPPAQPAWAGAMLGAAASSSAASRRAQASMPRGAPWSALDSLSPLELSRLLTGIAWLERSHAWWWAREGGEDGGIVAPPPPPPFFATPPALLRSLLRYCAARGRQMGRHSSNAVRALVVLQELSVEALKKKRAAAAERGRLAAAASADEDEAARLLSPDSPELLAARRGLVVEAHWALTSMSPEGLAVLLNGAATLSPGRPLWWPQGGEGDGGCADAAPPQPPPPPSYERWKDAALAVVEQRASQCPVLPALDGDAADPAAAAVPERQTRALRATTTPRQLALAAAGLARLGVRPPDAVLRRVLDAAAVRPFGGATLGVLREALDALLEGELLDGGAAGGSGAVQGGEGAAAAAAAAALAAREGDDDDAFAAFVDAQLAKVTPKEDGGLNQDRTMT